jgi:hypothetical protein
VAAIVHAVGGVQAQDEHAAALGIRARGEGITAGDIDRARVHDRSIVRTWCMRGTLHVIPADLLPAMLAVFGPVHVRRGRRRLAQLGLDEEASRHATEAIRRALARQGPLTRRDIALALRRDGVVGQPHDRATVHLIRRACLLGVACEVGSPGTEPSYALRDDWLPAPLPERAAALGGLAAWYVAAYQPTGPEDLAAWSGLPAADVRAAWEQMTDLVAVGDPQRPLWRHAGDRTAEPPAGGTPVARLLPAFDSYLLGYRDREHAVAPEHAPAVHPGGGIIRPTVLVDGRVVGTWRIERSRAPARLAVQAFTGLDRATVSGVERETADVGRFTGRDLTLTMVGAFGAQYEPLRT